MTKLLATLLISAAPLLAQVSVKWETSLDAALKRAKAENKPLFVDVWAEWCPPCQMLKQKVFPTPEANQALMAYVPVSLMVQYKDRSPVKGNEGMTDRFKVTAFPTLVILDPSGKELRRQVGAFSTGADFAAWLAAGK